MYVGKQQRCSEGCTHFAASKRTAAPINLWHLLSKFDACHTTAVDIAPWSGPRGATDFQNSRLTGCLSAPLPTVQQSCSSFGPNPALTELLKRYSFIHSFLGRWANHDHLTSSLKHIINQTNI